MSDQIMTVQGSEVNSVNEYNVAQALDRMKLEYIYQYSFNGGNIRGGQIIDFLIEKPPSPIPLQVQGEYWHSASMDTELAMKNADVAQEFGVLLEIWGSDCETIEAAYDWCMNNIGV
jgi:hypothetical protein